jgi:hypothetical protein
LPARISARGSVARRAPVYDLGLVNAIPQVFSIFGAAVGGYRAAKLAPAEPTRSRSRAGSLALLFVTPMPS